MGGAQPGRHSSPKRYLMSDWWGTWRVLDRGESRPLWHNERPHHIWRALVRVFAY